MPLAIKIGGLATVLLDKRTCKMCTNTDKDIEDERLFLLTCNLYDDLREIMFKNAWSYTRFLKIC